MNIAFAMDFTDVSGMGTAIRYLDRLHNNVIAYSCPTLDLINGAIVTIMMMSQALAGFGLTLRVLSVLYLTEIFRNFLHT